MDRDTETKAGNLRPGPAPGDMRASFQRFLSNPYLPNILTLGRISAVVVVILGLRLFGGGLRVCQVVSAFYLVAALSDLLDGYLARRFKNESNLGRFLDPMADKLLVASALIMLIPLGRVEAWVAFLIIAREIAVTSLRAVAVERGLVIAASPQGKQKTLAQNIALFCLLYHYPLLWADAHKVGTVILYVALFATYWSGFWYFHDFLAADRAKDGKASAPKAAAREAQGSEGAQNPAPPGGAQGPAGDEREGA
ncbi:MAG: CDP-diacylglycerol--glycerol-3-phosphate 3-phosphatidyltransferase [Deltaproteobacteria bacterium]|jgi:CDP-diacylglycerol--glycerol-3-phosphate 3-phosphatidyltransferase|nr:CDP-diacylglycerol--glycerol-3-phosphate 3-phosphatidyltransferase [Deltaproteobacteria bacterium]